jgi:hypothetical protein
VGFKLWSTNELATSSDVNTYLMKQTIITCTSGTRPASPVNGMHIYQTDSSQLLKWNGSSWEIVTGSRNVSLTPTLSSTGTAPTLGTGSIRAGYYAHLPGPSVLFYFYIKFGTSGVAVGTGNYLVSLPFTSTTPFGVGVHPAVGTTQFGDSSSGAVTPGSCFVDPSTGANVGLASASGGTVGPASPWTWAASDYISGQIIYTI